MVEINNQYFIKLIREYQTKSPDEDVQSLEHLIYFIENDPQCFERIEKENAVHLASNVLLFTPGYKELLCLWHKKIQAWTFPGGHCDGNPDIFQVAYKELEEETGIKDVTAVNEVPFHIQRFDYDKKVFGYTKSIYGFFFAVFCPQDQEPRNVEPDKCGEMRWFNIEEFEELTKDDKYHINAAILKKWQRILL